MSTNINYRREAYTWKDKYGDSCYVILTEQGSSNVWEIGNRRRARDWYVTMSGAAYSVYGAVARYCASASGGMLIFLGYRGNGNYMTQILAGMRAYDRAIKSAQPIELAVKNHPELKLEIEKAVANT